MADDRFGVGEDVVLRHPLLDMDVHGTGAERVDVGGAEGQQRAAEAPRAPPARWRRRSAPGSPPATLPNDVDQRLVAAVPPVGERRSPSAGRRGEAMNRRRLGLAGRLERGREEVRLSAPIRTPVGSAPKSDRLAQLGDRRRCDRRRLLLEDRQPIRPERAEDPRAGGDGRAVLGRLAHDEPGGSLDRVAQTGKERSRVVAREDLAHCSTFSPAGRDGLHALCIRADVLLGGVGALREGVVGKRGPPAGARWPGDEHLSPSRRAASRNGTSGLK